MLKIRPFRPEDYRELYRIWRATKQLALDRKWLYALRCRRDPELFLVAEWNGRVVGGVIATHDIHFSHIHHLAIDPEYQGRGIGTRLLEAIEAVLRRRGTYGALITVSRRNPAYREVLRFYQHRGYRTLGDYTHLGKLLASREELEALHSNQS